jgi:hypothetical protein
MHLEIKDDTLRIILKSELNTKNKMTAFGALAVPVLRFSFVIVDWRVEERHKSTAKLERY